MDTKLINEFGTAICCYRLRTARQKTRMQYEDFDKRLIALSKEENILYRNKYRPEWEPLMLPYQRGWERFFVLRDDVANSKHAQLFEGVLKKINTFQWSYRKDFKIKKRRFGRKIYAVKDQQLLKPNEAEFRRFEFSNAEKQFFYAEYTYEKFSGKFIKRYVFTEPWRFVLRVKPNMITKRKKIDSAKETRLQEIRNYIEGNGYRKRINKIWYRHKRSKWDKYGKRNDEYAFRNKSFSQILDMINEAFY